MRRKFSATVAIRSVSLTRSSVASRTVSPFSLIAPSTASTGISSISAAVKLLLNLTALDASGLNVQIADQLAARLLDMLVTRDLCAHAYQEIDQGRARGV